MISEGGGYGTYVNAIVPYMQRYLPGNPKIIVQHMQGAGGLTVDGTVAQPTAMVALGATLYHVELAGKRLDLRLRELREVLAA